ncbi:MAG TPA: YoaK family protein, partial [Ktedonobacterales bacterium]
RGSRRKITAVLVPEVLLLLAFMLYGQAYLQESRIQPQAAWSFYLLVALAVLAMGLQTASLRRAGGVAVHTTYVTGMLTHMAEEGVRYLFWLRDRAHSWRRLRVALWASPRQTSFVRAALLAGIWLLYAIGAVSSGFLVLRWGLVPLVLPITVLLVVIALDLIRPIPQP